MLMGMKKWGRNEGGLRISMWVKAATLFVICLTVVLGIHTGASAAMRKEVVSSTATLPDSCEFNVIAEPFDWGKDVTRLMLNPGKSVNISEVSGDDFNVTATHYSEQAYKTDFQGTRKVMNAYPVDAQGNKVDDGNYIIIELEYGSGVQGAHTGSYSYASYYTPLKLTYNVEWDASSDVYKQHEVVNLVCDEFILDRYIDSSIENTNYNFVDYAFYEPQQDNEKHPLIIFFHGMGEGGGGTLKNQGVQMYAYPECAFAESEIQGIMGNAYVLLPQSPATWPTNGFTNESGYLEVVNSLIDNIIDENPNIDTNRIYVGGLSMGGYMAARVILNRPEKYAAAFLCSQAYAITAEDAEKLKDLPIWISCCETDGTCKMDPYTYASYEKLVAAGAEEVKCAVMEGNETDPTSRFRFYSSDREGYETYIATQENENTVKGQFVWDNVSYSGHNGGWVPVFANGQYYYDDSDNKITIMDWVASQNRVENLILDTTKVKTNFIAGEAFTAANLGVTAIYRDGTSAAVTDYTISAVDTSKAGAVSVTITYSGVSAVYNITVSSMPPVPVISNTPVPDANRAKITLSLTSTVLYPKGKNKLAIKAETTGTAESVVWVSSDSEVASVNAKGVVTAKKVGTATITASVAGVKAECKITVKKNIFKVAKTKLIIKKGKTAKIKVTVKPKAKVVYKSSSSKIAKVNQRGVVMGRKKGTAKITVRVFGIKKIIKVKVK